MKEIITKLRRLKKLHEILVLKGDFSKKQNQEYRFLYDYLEKQIMPLIKAMKEASFLHISLQENDEKHAVFDVDRFYRWMGICLRISDECIEKNVGYDEIKIKCK